MALIPDSVVQEVLDKTDMAALVGDYVRLEKRGGRLWACCPFHSEKTPSFSVTPERGLFYCFGCHKGGNAASFVMEIERLEFPEAIRFLAEKAGLRLPDASHDSRIGQGRRDQLEELYSRVAKSFRYLLESDARGAFAKEYLESRKVSPEMREAFGLGYAPADRSWLWRFLTGKGYSPEFLSSSGLFGKAGRREAFFADRLMFPIRTRRGRVCAFGGRILRGEGPKYLNSVESELFKKGETLFGFDLAAQSIKDRGEAVLCEGYMDVIAMKQAGIDQCVAPLGTAFTEAQARMLKRYAAKIALMFDSDEAGRKAAIKALSVCETVGLEASFVSLQGAKDASEALDKFGPDALRNFVECRINEFDFLISLAGSTFDLQSPEGRSSACVWFFEAIKPVESGVRRDIALEKLAQALSLDILSIKEDFEAHRDTGALRRKPAAELAREDEQGLDFALFAALALHPEHYPEFRSGGFCVDDIEGDRARKLAVALEEAFRMGTLSAAAIIERLGDQELKRELLRKGASDEYAINTGAFVRDGSRRIEARMLERKKERLKARLMRAQAEDGMGDEAKALLSEIMGIDRELITLKGKF